MTKLSSIAKSSLVAVSMIFAGSVFAGPVIKFTGGFVDNCRSNAIGQCLDVNMADTPFVAAKNSPGHISVGGDLFYVGVKD